MAGMILSLLLSLSVSGGMMIIVTFCVCRLFRKKVSSQWQYYIWLVVLARFLMPFAPEQNLMRSLWEPVWSVMNTETVDTGRTDTSGMADTGRMDTSGSEDADLKGTSRSGGSDGEDATDSISKAPSAGLDAGSLGEFIHKSRILKMIWERRGYFCMFWLMMAVLLFLRKVTIYQSFVRYVRSGSTFVDEVERLEVLSTVEEQLGIHRVVDLWVNPLIASPMLIGFWHPRIVLPDNDLSEQAFYYTTLHELMHYKRKDMYYKWMIQAVICMYWFHPLVYLVGREMNRLCELSCDEAVVGCFETDQERREYAATLLNAMASADIYKESLASLTLSENKKRLKERLEAIMEKRKNIVVNRVLAAILTMTIACTGIFAGSYTVGASNMGQGKLASQTESPEYGQTGNSVANITGKSGSGHSKSDVITSEQADKMALELTNKIWVWDWVEFFVPYMSAKGAKKLIPASRNSQWAGAVDMTTGKKIKFTKKQIDSARKKKPSKSLTCGDIDAHALMIMQSNGDWDCISFMLPYMTHKGIRAVVRCYNSKHGGRGKIAKDYY